MIHGIDVSSYQSRIEWQRVAERASFSIPKITEGNSSTNPLAKEQIAGADSAGLLVLVYHFARPNGPNWEEDARLEAERAIDLSYGKPIVLDIERNEPLTATEIPYWREWCNAFRAQAKGHLVGPYSYRYFVESIGLDDSWSELLFLQASYPLPFDPDHGYAWPKAAKPWPRVDIHQHGGDANGATFPGVLCPSCGGKGCSMAWCRRGQMLCDVDAFAGTREELQQLVDVALAA